MKYSLVNGVREADNRLISCCLVLASLALGFGLSWNFCQTSVIDNAVGGRGFVPHKPADSAEQHNSEPAVKFVQEPLGRSSFRPDFSRGLGRVNQRDNSVMLRTFADVVNDTRLSTVVLFNSSGNQIALGAVVNADGWIATKATQLPPSGSIIAQLFDGSEHLAEIVQQVTDVDIALLRVKKTGLKAIQWAGSSIPNRGSWLATTDLRQLPTAVGVVSAGAQRVSPAKAVLGVSLEDTAAGVMVGNVLIGTGAEEAGIRKNDLVIALNGAQITRESAFKDALRQARGGEVVKLSIRRDEQLLDIEAKLMDLASELHEETEMEVNGRISARATGFARVFTHDTVLDPNQCGGPVCNLDGQVVGLNIARAGRVSTYALPADVARPLLEQMIDQATLVSRPITSPEVGLVR